MKIIEMQQEYLITCDTPGCTFKIKNESGDPTAETRQYINTRCPACGENLLTVQDYTDAVKLLKTIKTINKWFGWLSLFMPKKPRGKTSVRVHNGIKINNIHNGKDTI